MTGKQTMFFTVLEDIEPILKDIEMNHGLHYYNYILSDNKNIPQYASIFEAPNLGFTEFGEWLRNDSYFVTTKDVKINIREVPQRRGGMKYIFDHIPVKKSIHLEIGGTFLGKENIIVAGRVSTIFDDETSLQLYKLFSSKIKKNFKYIDHFYVGKNAEEKLKSGWRLTTGLREEYDLKPV